MTLSDISFRSRPAEKSFLRLFFAVLLFGTLTGCCCGILQCSAGQTVLPSLSSVSILLSSRGTLGLILTDIVFSVLIATVTLLPCRRLLYCVLFFVKGFCISYLVFIFVFSFRSLGLLFAAGMLLFHSFLLLPLQLLFVFSFGFLKREEVRFRAPLVSAFCLAVAGCIVFDSAVLPKILLHF